MKAEIWRLLESFNHHCHPTPPMSNKEACLVTPSGEIKRLLITRTRSRGPDGYEFHPQYHAKKPHM